MSTSHLAPDGTKEFFSTSDPRGRFSDWRALPVNPGVQVQMYPAPTSSHVPLF